VTTFHACSSPAPTPVKPQPAPAILSEESVHTMLSITHHTRKRPSTGTRTTHGPHQRFQEITPERDNHGPHGHVLLIRTRSFIAIDSSSANIELSFLPPNQPSHRRIEFTSIKSGFATTESRITMNTAVKLRLHLLRPHLRRHDAPFRRPWPPPPRDPWRAYESPGESQIPGWSSPRRHSRPAPTPPQARGHGCAPPSLWTVSSLRT
jgi:hypothetical protein